MAGTNGQTKEKFDGKVLTAGYAPGIMSFPPRLLRDQGKFFTWPDVEDMRVDPRCRFGMSILGAPIAGVSWQIKCEGSAWRSDDPDPMSIGKQPEQVQFIHKMWRRLWGYNLHKILSMFEYGSAGGEIVYKFSEEDTRWELDCLQDIHLADIVPMVTHRKLVALDVKNIPGSGGRPVRLPSPRWWFVSHRARFGRIHGHSRYVAAWERYTEKTSQKGAIDSRRTFYFKNAFTGAIGRYPQGLIEIAPGQFRSCQEYFREVLEKYETGGVMALPNTVDEHGNYQWTFEPAQVPPAVKDLRDYIKDLDAEIFEGMEIPAEVVQAADTGSGWSGRSIPLLVFLASLDPDVAHIFECMDRQMLWHLMRVNYGPVRYELEPISLVPKGEDPNKNGKDAPPKPAGQNPAPGGQQPPQPNPPVQLSAVHAPAGGVSIGGTQYVGGQFIPKEVLDKATPEERAKVDGAAQGPSKSLRTPTDPAAVKIHGIFGRVLDKTAALSAEQKKSYHAAMGHVLASMPPAALKSVNNNLKGLKFFPSQQTMTEALIDRNPMLAERLAGGMVGGCFTRSTATLYLDGEGTHHSDAAGKTPRTNVHETYAHEFGHAVEGPNEPISNSAEWQEAYKDEILPNARLSQYATTHPAEGLAEFARMLWGVQASPERIRKHFPKCSAVFAKHGLMEAA